MAKFHIGDKVVVKLPKSMEKDVELWKFQGKIAIISTIRKGPSNIGGYCELQGRLSEN